VTPHRLVNVGRFGGPCCLCDEIPKDDMSVTCKTNGIRKSAKFWSKNLQESCLVYITVNGRMKQEDIIKFIKSQRLRWAAHVMRMVNTRTTTKITEWTQYKTRPVGRPRLRWMDQVEEDLKRMKIVGWRAKVEDRQEWNRIVEQTKTHPGL